MCVALECFFIWHHCEVQLMFAMGIPVNSLVCHNTIPLALSANKTGTQSLGILYGWLLTLKLINFVAKHIWKP